MDNSLAMIEYATVSSGMAAADLLAKTANIRLLTAKTVCPGKYLVMFAGELGSLKSAVDAVVTRLGSRLIDSFILGNPHPSVLEVIDFRNREAYKNSLNEITAANTLSLEQNENINSVGISDIDTLGVIETQTSASAVISADIAAKAAKIRLLEIHLAKHMCGKAYTLFTGSLASVDESIAAISKHPDISGHIIDSAVISAADKGFVEALLRDLNYT